MECAIAQKGGVLSSQRESCHCAEGQIVATCLAPDGDTAQRFTCASSTSDPVQYMPSQIRSARASVLSSHKK